MTDDELQKRLDALEALIAQLTIAYAEVWMVVEGVLNELNLEKSPEDKAEFWKNLDKVRVKFFEEMNKARLFDVGTVNPDFEAAVENLVTGKLPDSPNQ